MVVQPKYVDQKSVVGEEWTASQNVHDTVVFGVHATASSLRLPALDLATKQGFKLQET